MSLLSASQLSCEKQDRILFENINFSVDAGELVFLKGENGAGKTSLLRILVGLSAPSSGEVSINDTNVHANPALACQYIVYIGHKLGVNGLFSPLENLRYYCQTNCQANCQTHSTQNVSDADILQILHKLNLEALEYTPVKQLSAGQQRRVALAKLWLNKQATLWVLDEPFTALDAETIDLLERQIQQFLQNKGAVIMTSHQASSLLSQASVFELEYRW